MYVTGLANVTITELNPDYFRRSALESTGMDRRTFLERELINLQSAIYQYQNKTLELMQQGAALDGVNDIASWLTTIGASVGTATTGTPVGIIGWVVAGAGFVWNILEKKKDQKKARDLQAQAQRIQLEATQIQDYLNRYNSQLQLIKLRPVLLGGAIGIIILKRR